MEDFSAISSVTLDDNCNVIFGEGLIFYEIWCAWFPVRTCLWNILVESQSSSALSLLGMLTYLVFGSMGSVSLFLASWQMMQLCYIINKECCMAFPQHKKKVVHVSNGWVPGIDGWAEGMKSYKSSANHIVDHRNDGLTFVEPCWREEVLPPIPNKCQKNYYKAMILVERIVRMRSATKWWRGGWSCK
jgi:hypothetical protein